MDIQNQTFKEDVPGNAVPKRKKRHTGLILFLVILVVAFMGAALYYFYQRQKPTQTVEQFLESVQEMDFDSMSALLQNTDLSLLDEADIRDETYSDFFHDINSKMTFDITANHFRIHNGTASVTAHIRYIDGSNIYKETITEFLRQIVSTAFSGESLTEQETRETLSSLLHEKAQSVEDSFSETEITYPIVKTENGWKIVSLDEETVTIMSANFKTVEDEINQSLSDMESGNGSASQTAPEATESDRIDMDTDTFSIRYTSHTVGNDFGGDPCLMVYYDYTNNGTSPSSAMVDVSLQAYQNGEMCSAAIPEANDPAIDNYMSEIQPGQTVNVCQAFSLTDQSDVTLQAGEAFSFSGGTTTSQIIKLQ